MKNKRMLAALGQLNSDILTAHYDHTMPAPATISNMVRRASALKRRAHMNLSIAADQHVANEEDVEMMREAAAQRHVSRHTTQRNTMCVGPCVRVPRHLVSALQTLARKLEAEEESSARVDAVARMTSELRKLPPSSLLSLDNPRLCVSTGLACAGGGL